MSTKKILTSEETRVTMQKASDPRIIEADLFYFLYWYCDKLLLSSWLCCWNYAIKYTN